MLVRDLTPHPDNPRQISDKKLVMLKKSLKEFGDLSGIVYNKKTGHVIGGHQRLKVLPKDAKIKDGFILVGKEKFTYREVSWDPVKEKAANIAANQHGGEWDIPKLTAWLAELSQTDIDMDLTGFEDKELKEFLSDGLGKGLVDEDEVPVIAKAVSKLGQVYQLGRHRLMCGSSTSRDNTDQLMNKEQATICFTSPPYNMGATAKLRNKNSRFKDSLYVEQTDHRTQPEYFEFLKEWTTLALSHSKYVFCNIQCLAGNKLALPDYWYHFKNYFVDLMVWDKEHCSPTMHKNVLNSLFEMIFIFASEENPSRVIRSGPGFHSTLDNIFRLCPIGKKDPLAKDHGAVFPVALPEFFISTFTNENEIVYEPFCGSGSTLIACEKSGRICYAMELEPLYIDVTIKRWENFTGEKAKLIRG